MKKKSGVWRKTTGSTIKIPVYNATNLEVYMISIKTVLAGLMCISLCMANISGTVTDADAKPVADAVVQLEKSGQTATTGTDGRFTLVMESTGAFSGNDKQLPGGLSASISGNLMTITAAERLDAEIAAFDISGRSLFTMRKTLDAGCHPVSLPYRGAGINLYKIRLANREFVLKGNSFNGILSVSPVQSQGSFLKLLAKTTAEINDVITVKKDGLLLYKVMIGNRDTTGIAIKMISSAGTVTDGDGIVYQTVKIGTQVWTVENLRTTKYNDGTLIPLVTQVAEWKDLATPGYCYFNNTVNADNIRKFGALYNWYVMDPANPKKIAPAGWHVPTDGEWDTLENYLIANGYNWNGERAGNQFAKSIAERTDWKGCGTSISEVGNDLSHNNASGFSALPGGYRYDNGDFSYDGSEMGSWWSSDDINGTSDVPARTIDGCNNELFHTLPMKTWGLSIRLIKD
jgi:uncharacterized protein (TIGR02145 family)